MKTYYYVSWSPRVGESTFTRCFGTEDERDRYIRGIDAKSIHKWENEYAATDE